MIRILSTFCMFLATTGYAQDDWTLQTPPVSPLARGGHAMAYIGDDKVLMFGGALDFDGTLSNETWIYDLSENLWTQITPSRGVPSARYKHSMAYIGDDKVVLFGGVVDFLNETVSNQTFIYDLSENNWAPLLALSVPAARQGHAMSFVGGDQAVLCGGEDGVTIYSDTWVFTLSTFSWTLKNPTTIPSIRTQSFPMAYVGGDQVLLFAHSIDPINLSTSTTWLYDLSEDEWQLNNELTIPTPSLASGMAALSGSDWVLLFAGDNFLGGPINGTFVYDLSDNTWSLQSPSTTPAHRYFHAMASISTGKVLMFGGIVGANLNNETWVYSATLPAVTHTILATAGAGGSITPSGSVVVNQGDNQSFTITPDANYEIADVLVDGISVGSVASHTFNNVTANHTIAASFTAIQHTITATAGPNGSIAPSGAVVVNQGNNQSFTITPDANYQIADVLVDGISVGSVASHTFNNVTADHTIAASFSEIANGAPAFISPTPECGSTINVDAGSPASFTISAEDGDAGAVVTLSVSGMPSGSSMDPSLPTQGNPVSSMFTWTPTASDLGSHQVTYTATDNLGAAVSCTLTVQVADVPPPPSAVCPHSQGYWKNHSSKWPGSALSLMLGTVNNYNQSQLLSILNAAPRGDASIILAHQLIAAKLNVANGSPVPADVQSAITNADAAISTATIPMGIKANTTLGGYMTSLASLLDQYNNNLLTLNCVAMDKTKGDQREIVTKFALFQNFPNPFNPSTQLSWQSPVAGHQTLKVYDVLGNEVATLVDEYKDAGRYETTFDASRLASGIYFYRLRAGTFVETRKMLLVR